MNIPNFEFDRRGKKPFPFRLEKLAAFAGYNPEKPHRHNYYEIFFFEKGGGLHMIDFEEIEIQPDHVHIVQPNQVHYMKREEASQGLVIKFPLELFLSNQAHKEFLYSLGFMHNRTLPSLIKFEEQAFCEIWELLLKLKGEYEAAQEHAEAMMMHYIGAVLVLCHRNFPYTSNHEKQEGDDQLFLEFQQLLETHFESETRVSFYQEKLAISVDKLNRIIKENTGKTASQLINNRLLLEVKRLLLHDEKSIKEVAYSLNFNDDAYFNRWFKKMEDCSPGEFRKLNQEKYNR